MKRLESRHIHILANRDVSHLYDAVSRDETLLAFCRGYGAQCVREW